MESPTDTWSSVQQPADRDTSVLPTVSGGPSAESKCVDIKHSQLAFLPTEILSYITLLALLPLDTSIWGSPVLAVSSWWRDCAFHTAQIWSCIEITEDSPGSERLECWFHRSGDTCPLYVTVRDMNAFHALETSWPGDVSAFSSRIYSLTIIHDSFSGPDPLPIQLDTPNLRELDAQFWYHSNKRRPLTLFKPRSSIPLKRLRLYNRYVHYGVINVSVVDVASLTSLVLSEEISHTDILNLLPHAPHLHHFGWNLSQFSPKSAARARASTGISRLALPAMVHMALWGKDGVLLSVLQMIQAPSLQKLSLEGRWDVDELRGLLSLIPEYHNLTHLKVHNDEEHQLSAADVASLIRDLPNLEYLDPKWQDSNIDGVLAQRHGHRTPPKSIIQGSTSPTIMCRDILFLPIGYSLSHSFLTRERLCACLTSLLNCTNSHNLTLSEADGSPNVRDLSPGELVVTVDVNTHTMVSIMGASWHSNGRVQCVESLEFPDTWA